MVCKVALGFSRCGECCRRGRTGCDASGLEDSDCLSPFWLHVLLLTYVLVERLRRALDKARSERASFEE